MVYHEGKYHLYYQHNPFGIFWGNMHWGHFVSEDLVHWDEQPIVLFQNTQDDMMFSGGGFVDHHNTAGYGEGTLFIAFTSTGRGECLAYSRDGGTAFTEIPENPVVRHSGRDPKIIWYPPQEKWVMVVYNDQENKQTLAIPQAGGPDRLQNANITFYDSKDLRHWSKTGVFTDPDRRSLYECPEFFELPMQGDSAESRWCLMAASNRYFLGTFDGSVFHAESGPHGDGHGDFYAAQTFSNTPDGRWIQIGWARTETFLDRHPDQIVNQCLSLPHELTLRSTPAGPRIHFNPVAELSRLRDSLIVDETDINARRFNELLQVCRDELTEVEIRLDHPSKVQWTVNGIAADFTGSTARLFNDRVVNEIYVDDGATYRVNARQSSRLGDSSTHIVLPENVVVQSIRIHRLKSIH